MPFLLICIQTVSSAYRQASSAYALWDSESTFRSLLPGPSYPSAGIPVEGGPPPLLPLSGSGLSVSKRQPTLQGSSRTCCAQCVPFPVLRALSPPPPAFLNQEALVQAEGWPCYWLPPPPRSPNTQRVRRLGRLMLRLSRPPATSFMLTPGLSEIDLVGWGLQWVFARSGSRKGGNLRSAGRAQGAQAQCQSFK